ncbi:hypothetical protein [Halobaculum sp. P14]|uniref:hypothetical protein n=1 Tax=Halobaculum sp. P14 TaxID=3421638 RepID=UPI003EBF859B
MSDAEYGRAARHVLDWVHENTAPEPNGEQNVYSSVWAGTNNLKAQARKDRIPFDVAELDSAYDELLSAEEIVVWHGLVAPATDDHLDAILQDEAKASQSRQVLVAKINRLRSDPDPTDHDDQLVTDGGTYSPVLDDLREERESARNAYEAAVREGHTASVEQAAKWYRDVSAQIADAKRCVGGDAR